ncbi:MAG: hypothetical protein M3Y12_01730 [Bacteroidota bacterium]|nr:hypothetical protein [Bacteroidota bacterium]
MIKVLLIILVVFTTISCNRHLLTESEFKSKKVYVNIAEALESPKDVYSLNLHMPDSLPKDILKLKRLNELDVFKPKFNSLPKFIGRFQNLQTLIILEANLKSIPSEICELKKLKWLRIWNSKLIELPSKINKLKNLETLELFANDIRQLPRSITKLKRLKEIGIDSNHNLDFYDSFNKLAQLPKLTCLNINYYPLDTLPSNIIALKNLQIITLWNNSGGKLDIEDMIEKLSKLQKLEKLDLSGNPVDEKSKMRYVEALKKQHDKCEVIWNSY